MTKLKKSDFRRARERIDSLAPERREKVEAGAASVLEAMHLAEMRKALSVTQTNLASRTGLKQAEVSRIENNLESVQIKTLARYVAGLGGSFKIVAQFPDGTQAEVPMRSGKPVKSKITVAAPSAPPRTE